MDRGSEVSIEQQAVIKRLADDAIRLADPTLLDEHNVEGTPLVAEIFKVLVACHIQNKNIRENEERAKRVQAEVSQYSGEMARNIKTPLAYRETGLGDI